MRNPKQDPAVGDVRFGLVVKAKDGERCYKFQTESEAIRGFQFVSRLADEFLGGVSDLALVDEDGVVLREMPASAEVVEVGDR